MKCLKHSFNNQLFFILLTGLVLTSPSSNAEKHSLDHSRMGSHGMVLFTDGNLLFASHLPLYHRPHDLQLIYRIKTAKKEEIIAYLQADKSKIKPNSRKTMVTILPQPFDLNKLTLNESLKINVTVFKGHFERGGSAWLEQQNVEFTTMVFNQQIITSHANRSLVSNKTHQWAVIDVPAAGTLNQHKLFVHIINEKPSFDAIVLGTTCSEQHASQMNIKTKIHNENLQLNINCKKQSLLYFETQDFETQDFEE